MDLMGMMLKVIFSMSCELEILTGISSTIIYQTIRIPMVMGMCLIVGILFGYMLIFISNLIKNIKTNDKFIQFKQK